MDRPAKRARLLSDSEESESASPQPAAKSNGIKLKVNEEYARRFEHNKKREEQHRLEEKYGKTSSASTRSKQANGTSKSAEDEEEDDGSEESSSDETEDDVAELATEDVDQEIMQTLEAIRRKDPRVYDKGVKFYKEFEVDAEEGKKKEKPMYLRDYHRQNLLNGGIDGEEEGGVEVPRTYQQEQERMQRDIVRAMHGAAEDGAKEEEVEEDEDDFLVAKPKSKHEDMKSSTEPRQITDIDVAEADKDPETYLSNFMAARAWLPTESSKWQAFDSDDSEDDKRAEMFEEAYNMRFEDPATANEKLQSFARDVGKYSVRRDEKKSARQRTRDREREKKEAEKRGREEEKARLRKLKIEEAEEKVRKIKEAAGLGKGDDLNVEEWRDVIEGDFDDERWEKEMRRRFGDDYYAAQEEHAIDEEDDSEDAGKKKKRKLKKPKWDDDIDIKDLVPEFEDEEKKKPDITLTDDEDEPLTNGSESADVEMADIDEDERKISKKKNKKSRAAEKMAAKRAARLERRAIEDIVDANLPLTTTSSSKAGPVGFRYRETSPNTFGLSARDILFADDAALNQYAGLKKLAAWREEEKKRRDRKRFSKKGRLREWRLETFGREGVKALTGEGKEEEKGGKGDGEGKKKKRKRGKKVKEVEA